jgi:hypothetical protein
MSVQLENNIYNILSSTKLQTIHKYQYIHYNINLNFIDFMVITNNFIICVYSNYIEQYIDEFLKEIFTVQQYFQKPVLGIYMTFFKIPNFDEQKISHINKQGYNKIINIYNSDINILSQKFLNKLYAHNIYCYDNSGDCIMI